MLGVGVVGGATCKRLEVFQGFSDDPEGKTHLHIMSLLHAKSRVTFLGFCALGIKIIIVNKLTLWENHNLFKKILS